MTGITGTTDFQALIRNPDVDVVDICVPTPAHEALAIAALEAGKHVLCEKPLALDSASAAAHRRRGRARQGPLHAGDVHALLAAVGVAEAGGRRAALRRASSARRSGASRRCRPDGSRTARCRAAALLDLHIHDTDFVFHLFGAPDAVFSRGYSKTSGRTDHIVTEYLYDRGPALVSAEGSWCMADGFAFTMRYTVNFERATADFDIGREHQLIVEHGRQGRARSISPGDGYEAELAYFVDCVRTGRAPARVTAADAVDRPAHPRSRAAQHRVGRIERL